MADRETARWEGATAEALAAAWGVPAVHLFASVGSTNDVARALAAGGAPGGTVVLADEQRAGRGRVGRAWASPPGLGLWLSIVFRGVGTAGTGALPLLTGLAVARALDPLAAPHRVRLKWPNDLYLAGRKLGGILCEAAWEGGAPAFVVVGIGVNLLHAADDFPEPLRATATSLRREAASPPDRAAAAGRLVREVAALLRRPLALAGADLEEWAARDLLRGRAVTVAEPETGAALAAGVAAGLSRDGALLLDGADGARREIRSGTVRLAGDAPG